MGRRNIGKSAGKSDDRMPEPLLYCRIFDDQVPEQLCGLRRRELIAFGAFSCEDCMLYGSASDRGEPETRVLDQA